MDSGNSAINIYWIRLCCKRIEWKLAKFLTHDRSQSESWTLKMVRRKEALTLNIAWNLHFFFPKSSTTRSIDTHREFGYESLKWLKIDMDAYFLFLARLNRTYQWANKKVWASSNILMQIKKRARARVSVRALIFIVCCTFPVCAAKKM